MSAKQGKTIAKRACAACRKLHKSCSNNRPCERCVAKGITCVDTQMISIPHFLAESQQLDSLQRVLYTTASLQQQPPTTLSNSEFEIEPLPDQDFLSSILSQPAAATSSYSCELQPGLSHTAPVDFSLLYPQQFISHDVSGSLFGMMARLSAMEAELNAMKYQVAQQQETITALQQMMQEQLSSTTSSSVEIIPIELPTDRVVVVMTKTGYMRAFSRSLKCIVEKHSIYSDSVYSIFQTSKPVNFFELQGKEPENQVEITMTKLLFHNLYTSKGEPLVRKVVIITSHELTEKDKMETVKSILTIEQDAIWVEFQTVENATHHELIVDDQVLHKSIILPPAQIKSIRPQGFQMLLQALQSIAQAKQDEQ